MDQNQNPKKPAKNPKSTSVHPDVANDQLGENASLEFAEEYDNKTNQPTKQPTKNP